MSSVSHVRAHTPDPDVVLTYADHHGTAAAARHYGVNERTIRKWRAKHQPQADVPLERARTAPAEPVAQPASRGRARVYTVPQHAPAQLNATVYASAIARDGMLWRCPICGDLMPPLPGTTGAEWSATGCYLHQAQPTPVDDNETGPALDPVADPAPGPAPAHVNTALQSDELSGLTRPLVEAMTSDPARPPAPAPVVIRQIVRVPTPARQGGIVGWVQTHELIGPGPVLGMIIFLVIVLLCSL